MSHWEHYWPGQEFQALRVSAARCHLLIKGTTDDRIKLDCDLDSRAARDINIESGGGWLFFDFLKHHSDLEIHLDLPERQNWALNFTAAKGDLSIQKVPGRFQIMLGHGSLKIEDCAGKITALVGKTDIRLKNFHEQEAPLAPAWPREFERYFITENLENLPVVESDWEKWGEELGGRVRAWTLNSLHILGPGALNSPQNGLNLRVVRGQIELENSDFKSCSLSLGKGDLEIKGGHSGFLQGDLRHGQAVLKTLSTGQDWDLKIGRGDIRLTLDWATLARLDMATRDGDIRSALPLVRVMRPGPTGCHSHRMVGMLGNDQGGKIALIRLSTVHGNIDIQTPSPIIPGESGRSSPVATPAGNSSLPDALETGPLNSPLNQYRSSLEILQALSAGQITIAEADRLLSRLSGRDSS
jgi:hypothetical protein